MSDLQKFIEALKGTQFDIHYCGSDSSVTVLENIGGFQLEFLLHYTSEVKNYKSATYLQPEEYDIIFHNESHEEIALYDAEGMIELTDSQINEIDKIIEKCLCY